MDNQEIIKAIDISQTAQETSKIIGSSGPWTLIDENTCKRRIVPTFFKYRVATLSRGVFSFFGATDLHEGEFYSITLVYDGIEYDGRINKFKGQSNYPPRLSWGVELSKNLNDYEKSDDQFEVIFHRNQDYIAKTTEPVKQCRKPEGNQTTAYCL